MIIKIKFENWKSYSEPTTFSMEALENRGHDYRVQKIYPGKLELLPVAAIFGGNASGKSNLVQALSFAKNFIVNGVPNGYAVSNGHGISTDHFLLDKEHQHLPTKFSFELLIDDKIFEYGFEIGRKCILSEYLFEILAENNKKNIYKIKNGKIDINPDTKNRTELNMIFENKKDRGLFLTLVSKNFMFEMPVYNWFDKNLQVLFPKAELNFDKLIENDLILKTLNKSLKTLDCGAIKIDFEDYIPTSEELINYRSELEYKPIAFDPRKLVFAKFEENEIIFKKLVSYHQDRDSKLVKFDINANSDGTIRMFDLLPAIIDLTKLKENKVCIIDEIDQSLHFLLVKNLIIAYLHRCNAEIRSQLIFTTHNLMIMDSSIFRTDEMWLTKRNKHGSTKLNSIGKFIAVDSKKNVREKYLSGKFSGIPRMLLIEDQIKLPDPEGV